MKIAVTGASGLIGSALVPALRRDGHEVVRLVRRSPQSADELMWDPSRQVLEPTSLTDVDAVVHLAGAGVADKRWSAARKRTIVASRVDGTTTIALALAAAPARARVLLSASAVGYYGDTGDRLTDETGNQGVGFLADTCGQWEAATRPAAATTRVLHLRTGIVLTAAGGALRKQLPIFKAALGAPLGSGRQWVPWITLEDHLAAIGHLLTAATAADVRGAVNLVAPNPVTNREFTKALGKAVHRPTLPIPVPGFALRLALGDFAREGVLVSQRLSPAVLASTGFSFTHPHVDEGIAASL